jgi:hypothetical protein
VIVGSLFTPPPEPEQAARVEAPSPAVAEAPQRPEELGAPARREVRPAPPPPARAQREQRAASLADAETDAARRRDLAKAAPAPPAERKAGAETAAAPSAQAPAKESTSGGEVMRSRLALRPAAPDVSGRLAVTDREAATRALAELMAKAGGAEIARRAAADAMVIELTIPREAWAEFTRELAALGTWTPDHEPAELPAEIRVALRITS